MCDRVQAGWSDNRDGVTVHKHGSSFDLSASLPCSRVRTLLQHCMYVHVLMPSRAGALHGSTLGFALTSGLSKAIPV